MRKVNDKNSNSHILSFMKKYPKEKYSASEILKLRDELQKKYGAKIIPELKEKDLSAEEELARIEYGVLSDLLRGALPEIKRLDNQEIGLLKAEKTPSGRLANVTFMVLKLCALAWLFVMVLITINEFTSDSVLLFLLIGLPPFLVVTLLQVLYWYVAGIIEFEDIAKTFKDQTIGILGGS